MLISQGERKKLLAWINIPTNDPMTEEKLKEILERAKSNPAEPQSKVILKSYEQCKKAKMNSSAILRQILEDLRVDIDWTTKKKPDP